MGFGNIMGLLWSCSFDTDAAGRSSSKARLELAGKQ